MKKISLLIATAILCSANIGFAAKTEEKSRYEQIVACFNIDTKTFGENFIKNASDIEIIKYHKAEAENKISENKKSCTPALLKIVSFLFGLSATLEIGSIIQKTVSLGASNPFAVTVTTHTEDGTIITDTKTPLLIPASSLLSAAIAKYLFKKANSYGTETENLEKEIATDGAIIEKLESMQ